MGTLLRATRQGHTDSPRTKVPWWPSRRVQQASPPKGRAEPWRQCAGRAVAATGRISTISGLSQFGKIEHTVCE
jgi:hypothetical protein